MSKTKQFSLFANEVRFLEIKKHSALAQMNNVASLQQRKAMNAFMLIAKDILKRHPEANMFQVELGTLKWLAGIHGNDNKKLKTDLKNLTSLAIEYNILKKDEHERGAFPFLSFVSIRSKRWQTAIVTFSLAPPILAAIPEPEMRVKLRIYFQQNMTTKYGFGLWETLSDYKGIEEIKMTLEDFRKLMGISPEKYTVVTMLRKKVVDIAVRELNTKTDLKVRYEMLMTGKKTTGIKFYIEVKEEEQSLEDVNQHIVEKLTYYGFKRNEVKKWLRSRDEEYLLANITRVEEYLKKWKKIDDVKSYLAAAFKNDFRRVESEYEKEQKKLSDAKGLALEKVTMKRAEEAQKEATLAQKKKRLIKEKMADLSDAILTEAEKGFVTSIQHSSPLMKAYRKGGVEHSLVQGKWLAFLEPYLLNEEEEKCLRKWW